MTTWRNIRSAYVRARLRFRPGSAGHTGPGAPGRTSAAPAEPGEERREREALRSAVVAEQVGLVVQEEDARDVRLGEGTVEGQERRPDRLGRVARFGLVGRLVAHLADRDAARTHVLPGPLDRVSDSRECAAAPDQRGAIVGDRVGQSGVVAVAIAELALEAEPAGPLARGELAEEHRLARPADARERPVRVRRMGFGKVAVELIEQPVAAREVRRGNPVSWPKGVRQQLGSGLCVGFRHV